MNDDLEAELARTQTDLAGAIATRDQALRAAEAANAAAQLRESELGTAQAEIARLEAALREIARMQTLRGVRRLIAETLGK